MKRITRIMAIAVGSLVGLAVLVLVGLYVGTRGDYAVAPTVIDDPSLPSIEVLGVKLHAEAHGDPANPTVIVLHGGPGADYRSLLGLRALSDRYHVVFYDQRGAGLSQRLPAEQLTLDSYLSELDAIVDRYGGGEPVVLIGHSWGGMLGAAYLGHAPDKVARAVLAEPGFLSADEFADWNAYQQPFYQSLEYLWLATRTGFEASHVKGPDADASQDHLYSRIVHYFTNHPDNPYHCPGEAFDAPGWRFGSTASKAAAATPPEEMDRLGAGAGVYDGPVLFLAGACDTWIGPELQARHAAQFADAELVVIPDAGHDMFWDQPEATLAAVRGFLEE